MAREDAVRRILHIIDTYKDHHLKLVEGRVGSYLKRATPVIFGAGQNGKMLASMLRKAGIEPAAFADDTPGKQGTTIDDIPVWSVEIATQRYPDAAFVVSIFHPNHEFVTSAARLRRLGVTTVSLSEAFWAIGRDHLPFYFLGTPEVVLDAIDDILYLAERLADPISLDVLCRQIEYRLSVRSDVLPIWSANRLAPPPASRPWTYVDGGAFDGDTIIPFFEMHGPLIGRVVAIEPDPVTFASLRTNVERAGPSLSRITTFVNAALDGESGRRGFQSTAALDSGFNNDGAVVSTYSVDDLLAHFSVASPVFLKLDVEGSEADVIKGASQMLADPANALSLALYHRPSDLWALPRLVSEIRQGATFLLRTHGGDGADLMAYTWPS
jgi:FkbM family methyltransferase